MNQTRFIFITGGVVSSLGKGLASAALGSLLIERGYSVRLRKLDPYLNVDPGTMSPTQHGEVFVTEDGAETDLDLGHYERFTNIDAKKTDNVTAGKIYATLLSKERKGDYLGGTVQVIPHVTDLIKEFILKDLKGVDFALCEIGGTVGDIEALPFFETIRQMGLSLGKDRVAYIHVTLLPYVAAASELKTKPTQHSVKELRSIGIQPDLLLCRADRAIDKKDLAKIALFCNLHEDFVIPALDEKTIYQVPISYHEAGLDRQLLKHFNIVTEAIELNRWKKVVASVNARHHEVKIAIVGKYTGYKDSYKSLIEALDHAGIALGVNVKIIWINSRKSDSCDDKLANVDGILVPGGFGEDGVSGKLKAIAFARTNNIPFFGICYGMQLAVIEFMQNIVGMSDATSSEISKSGNPVIDLMKKWKDEDGMMRIVSSDMGGTMRLGSYECEIADSNSLAYKIYEKKLIRERHRHRYEVNIAYRKQLEEFGMKISGISPDGLLPEIVELSAHPFFIGVQFHPELKSRPFDAHPIFRAFVAAAKNISKNE